MLARETRIIQDPTPTQSSVSCSVSSTILEHEPEVLPTPINNSHEPDMITFADGRKFYIKPEWRAKSPLISTSKVLFENSDLFVKYVMPILKDEMLSSVDVDELHEISTVIQLCRNYGIQITDSQIINISDSFKLQKVINTIKHIVNDIKSIFHLQKAKRYTQFKTYWNEHIILLSKVSLNPQYQKLTADEIINTIINLSYLEISKLNFKYDNILYKFSQWLSQAIVDKSFDEIQEVNFKLSFASDGCLTDMLGDAVSFATSIYNSIPQKYKDKVGGAIMDKIKNISIVSDLLK